MNANDGYYIKKLLRKLIAKNKISANKVNISEIEKATYFAEKYHAKQTRHSGEPFYSHPIEVASIVSDYLFDTDTIIAAILHDVVEDTHSSLKQIELVFGRKVAEIVEILTKFTIKHQLSQEEAMHKINQSRDLEGRAITIKVIDRLHNLRTVSSAMTLAKQKNIAIETIKFYLSMARAANLPEIEQELQARSNRILGLS